ncbi:hypothetical protein BB561_002490 [Smittium simulii]|uniref:Uncharacterized protein n=1 Tax=Smittium simulii TaxID=133385 RepID=A0A2T9YQ96_9FUNG|nr:hypothetical protein BB561_002490 [Smittium simulii]
MENSYSNDFDPSLVAGTVVMSYLCADCGAENEIKPREPIRCRELVQFEAR